MRRKGEAPDPIPPEDVEATELAKGRWTCPHGVLYSGSDDLISGARLAHDELRGLFDEAQRLIREGDTDGLAELASRSVKQRAALAVER